MNLNNKRSLPTNDLNHTRKKQKGKKLSPVVLKPFWNTTSEEISRRLPSRRENTISYIVKGNLWTHNPYTPLIRDDEEEKRIMIPLDETKEQDGEEKKQKFKAKRIRIYPTKEQRKIIEKWFAACRWSYNQCAEAINNKTLPANKKALRDKFLHNRNFETENQWIKEIPCELRDVAILDTLKALKAHRAKKKENQNGFKFRFRSRFDTQNVGISKKHWGHTNKRSMFRLVLSKEVMKSAKHDPLPEKLLHDSRLIRDKLHRYFLCIPIPLEQKISSSTSTKIVALDPGVRTFMTTYDQDGEVHEFGKGDRTRLFRLAIAVDRLTSKRAAVKKNRHRKRNMRKAILRIYDRIRNLVDDTHKKLVNWLCETHQTILIPKFESGQMTKKEGMRLHTKSVRGMLHWAHFRFRERLLSKVPEYQGVQVKVVTEEYTSKTCGVCGTIHTKLGGNKVFLCPSCHWKCDRDINGARNILLKYLTEQQKTSAVSVGSLGPSPFSLFVKSEIRDATLTNSANC